MPWFSTYPSLVGWSTTAPTRIGTPTALTARSIAARASSSWKGSRSEEFSGQITMSGRSTRSASMSSASSRVASTWLLRIIIGRPRKSMPGCCTLPWTTAMDTTSPGLSAPVGTGTA